MKKKSVDTVNTDGKAIKLIVRSPGPKELQQAQMESNKAFRLAVDSGSMLRAELNDYLRKRGLWNDDMEKDLERINNSLYGNEKTLLKGGIKKSEAKKICLEMRSLRFEQAALLYNQRQNDIYTADAQAENSKFDYLVSACVFDEEGNRFFKDFDDYKMRATEDAAVAAATAFAEVFNNFDPEWEKKLPENEFLVKHGLANEKLQFINKNGKLVDSEGHLVNEEGRFINEAGEFVNRDGERVDEKGNLLIEFVPLIDDEDEVESQKEVEVQEPVVSN